jgi:hypothetical protein
MIEAWDDSILKYSCKSLALVAWTDYVGAYRARRKVHNE